MLDHSEYTIAWVVYMLSAIGLIAVWWRITRPLPWKSLQQLLRVLVAAPLLMPAPVAQGSADWAPALFVLLFDMTLVEGTNPQWALPFILYALILGLLVLVADGLFRNWQNKKRAF